MSGHQWSDVCPKCGGLAQWYQELPKDFSVECYECFYLARPDYEGWISLDDVNWHYSHFDEYDELTEEQYEERKGIGPPKKEDD